MPVLKPDDEIGGCIIIRMIARGGMGEVYLARQVSIDRLVAVKVLFPALVKRDARFADQFLREAQAAGRLNHPHIIAVHNVGEEVLREVTLRYFSMEYVDGENFREILDRSGPIEHRLIAQLMEEVGAALAYAARMGMTHHDIKPENIMLTRDGRIKLADFGLAMHHSDIEEAAVDDQGRRKVMGTPRYMSPEQARAKPTDHRSDQYSFGATLFHLATGHPPYRRDKARDLMMAHVTDPVPDPSDYCDVPDMWRQLIMRLMEKEPDKRFADPDDFLKAISDAVKKRDSSERKSGRPRHRRESVPAPQPSNSTFSMLAGVLIVLLIGAGGATWWILHSMDDSADEDSVEASIEQSDQGAHERALDFISTLDDDPKIALAQLQGSDGLRRPYFQAASAAMEALRLHEQHLRAEIEQGQQLLIEEQRAMFDTASRLVDDGQLAAAEQRIADNRILDITDSTQRRELQARQDALARAIADQRMILFRQQQIAIDRATDDQTLASLQATLAELDVEDEHRERLAEDVSRRRNEFAVGAAEQAQREQERHERIWRSLSERAQRHIGNRQQHQESDLRALRRTAERHRPQLVGSNYETLAAELATIAQRAITATEALVRHLEESHETITVHRARQDAVPARLLGLASNMRLLVDLDHSGTRMAVNIEDTDTDLAAILERATVDMDEPAAHVAAFMWCHDLPGAGHYLYRQADSMQTQAVVAILRARGEVLDTRPPRAGAATTVSAEDRSWSVDFADTSEGILALFDGAPVRLADQALRWHCDRAAPLLNVNSRRTMAEEALPTVRLARPLGSTTTIDFTIAPGSILLLGCERDGRRVRVGIDTRDSTRTWLDVALDRDGHVIFDENEPQSVPPIDVPLRLRLHLNNDGVILELTDVNSGQRLPLPTQRYALPGTSPVHLIFQTIQQQGTSQLDLARIVIEP